MATTNPNQNQNQFRAPNQYPFPNQNQPFGYNNPYFMMGPQPPFPFPNNMMGMGNIPSTRPPQQGPHPLMQPFLNGNGNFDFNKVMAGMDNINKFINKTGPMIKQISPLLNMFKPR